MPIYEFRCLKCHEISEVLFTTTDDAQEIKCQHCGGENLERVMSRSNFSMGYSTQGAGPTTSTRTCASGTCGTIEIPGRDD